MPLGTILIYNINKSNIIMWDLYINVQKQTIIFPAINPMGLGAPWTDAYPEYQQK